jgi:pimeloyl-ACP methyl ester carboxylesterase
VTGAVALGLAGITYQALATQADRRNFPPPGALVDVGGHRLHIQCAGAGRPTVVLEAGALAMSALWGNVQPAVAACSRVCSYDRAGLGWSEAGPEPRDARRIAGELRKLLRNAGEPPPYVLVGHSFGGLLVRVYADRYPEEVVGLRLLDPSHPDQVARLERALGRPSFVESHLIPALFPAMVRLGVLRFGLRFTDAGRRFDGLGPERAAEFRAFFGGSSHQSAGHAEMAAWEQTAAQARAARRLGELPLAVISAAETEPLSPERRVRLQLHEELASLSSRGSHQVLAGTTHGSLVTNRAHAAQVAESVRQLVELAGAGEKRTLRP